MATTNLHIDDKLLAKALKLGGKKTKRETVDEALTEYIRHREQRKIIDAFGTLEDEDFWDPAPIPTRTVRSGNGKKK